MASDKSDQLSVQLSALGAPPEVMSAPGEHVCLRTIHVLPFCPGECGHLVTRSIKHFAQVFYNLKCHKTFSHSLQMSGSCQRPPCLLLMPGAGLGSGPLGASPLLLLSPLGARALREPLRLLA